MSLITNAWLSYLDEVIPKESPQIQIKECKRAFYAGMISMFSILSGDVVTTVSDDEGVKIMENIFQELNDYKDKIGISE